jgi:hypothetical protein
MMVLRTLGLLVVLCAGAWGRPTVGEPVLPAAWEVEVRLEIVHDGVRRVRESRYALRLAEDRFRLDLGAVRVLGVRGADGAVLEAWHTHDPTTIFEARGEDLGLLLRTHLPAIWSGVLARWIEGDTQAYPLVGHDWPTEPSEQADPEMDGMVFLEAGSITVHTASQVPPGESFSEMVVIRRAGGLTRLELTYLPIEAGAPGSWGVDQGGRGGRGGVSSIRALKAKPAAIKIGEVVGGLAVFDSASRRVDLRGVFDGERMPRGQRRADGLLLIFERLDGSVGEVPDLSGAIARARTLMAVDAAERGGRRPRIVVRPVAVFDVPEFSREVLGAFTGKWSGLEGDALLSGVEAGLAKVLWTHPPRDSIDLFAPGARIAGVLIGPDGRLMGVVRLDEGDVDIGAWLSGILGVKMMDAP